MGPPILRNRALLVLRASAERSIQPFAKGVGYRAFQPRTETRMGGLQIAMGKEIQALGAASLTSSDLGSDSLRRLAMSHSVMPGLQRFSASLDSLRTPASKSSGTTDFFVKGALLIAPIIIPLSYLLFSSDIGDIFSYIQHVEFRDVLHFAQFAGSLIGAAMAASLIPISEVEHHFLGDRQYVYGVHAGSDRGSLIQMLNVTDELIKSDDLSFRENAAVLGIKLISEEFGLFSRGVIDDLEHADKRDLIAFYKLLSITIKGRILHTSSDDSYIHFGRALSANSHGTNEAMLRRIAVRLGWHLGFISWRPIFAQREEIEALMQSDSVDAGVLRGVLPSNVHVAVGARWSLVTGSVSQRSVATEAARVASTGLIYEGNFTGPHNSGNGRGLSRRDSVQAILSNSLVSRLRALISDGIYAEAARCLQDGNTREHALHALKILLTDRSEPRVYDFLMHVDTSLAVEAYLSLHGPAEILDADNAENIIFGLKQIHMDRLCLWEAGQTNGSELRDVIPFSVYVLEKIARDHADLYAKIKELEPDPRSIIGRLISIMESIVAGGEGVRGVEYDFSQRVNLMNTATLALNDYLERGENLQTLSDLLVHRLSPQSAVSMLSSCEESRPQGTAIDTLARVLSVQPPEAIGAFLVVYHDQQQQDGVSRGVSSLARLFGVRGIGLVGPYVSTGERQLDLSDESNLRDFLSLVLVKASAETPSFGAQVLDRMSRDERLYHQGGRRLAEALVTQSAPEVQPQLLDIYSVLRQNPLYSPLEILFSTNVMMLEDLTPSQRKDAACVYERIIRFNNPTQLAENRDLWYVSTGVLSTEEFHALQERAVGMLGSLGAKEQTKLLMSLSLNGSGFLHNGRLAVAAVAAMKQMAERDANVFTETQKLRLLTLYRAGRVAGSAEDGMLELFKLIFDSDILQKRFFPQVEKYIDSVLGRDGNNAEDERLLRIMRALFDPQSNPRWLELRERIFAKYRILANDVGSLKDESREKFVNLARAFHIEEGIARNICAVYDMDAPDTNSAVSYLGYHTDQGYIKDMLFALLHGETENVAVVAAKALGNRQDPEVAKKIIEKLKIYLPSSGAIAVREVQEEQRFGRMSRRTERKPLATSVIHELIRSLGRIDSPEAIAYLNELYDSLGEGEECRTLRRMVADSLALASGSQVEYQSVIVSASLSQDFPNPIEVIEFVRQIQRRIVSGMRAGTLPVLSERDMEAFVFSYEDTDDPALLRFMELSLVAFEDTTRIGNKIIEILGKRGSQTSVLFLRNKLRMPLPEDATLEQIAYRVNTILALGKCAERGDRVVFEELWGIIARPSEREMTISELIESLKQSDYKFTPIVNAAIRAIGMVAIPEFIGSVSLDESSSVLFARKDLYLFRDQGVHVTWPSLVYAISQIGLHSERRYREMITDLELHTQIRNLINIAIDFILEQTSALIKLQVEEQTQVEIDVFNSSTRVQKKLVDTLYDYADPVFIPSVIAMMQRNNMSFVNGGSDLSYVYQRLEDTLIKIGEPVREPLKRAMESSNDSHFKARAHRVLEAIDRQSQ